MKKAVLVALIILLGFFTNTSFAVEATVFGPVQYVRTAGEPNVHTAMFSANPGGGTLIVKNGTGEGEHRIVDALSSAMVTLNGEQIFGLADFSVGVYKLESTVMLYDGDNSISVWMASAPGSYLTIEVTQENEIVPPTVTISADPNNIVAGQSTTLSWSSTNADTVVIDQDIGAVPINGTTSVSPSETTTYTINATGPGGTATASVTVTVTYPPPTVTMSADPDTILIGESSMLTWNTTFANSASIDQGIGPVDVNGSSTVSPAETTTYTITATGPGGTATDNVTVTVLTPITLEITSPSDGETIYRPDVIVKGTITNSEGNETGVTVNGMSSIVIGGQFVANHVPLEEGENIITATATDTDGYTTSASITVHAETTGDYIRLSADTESGISPLEVTLSIEATFSFTDSSLTYTGPGEVETLDSTAYEYRVRMTTEGIYYFTAEVNHESNTYTDTIAIEVLSEAALDALLKAKWDGMKAALIDGDIQKALLYQYEGLRDKYEAIYNLLGSDLATKIQQMQDIELIYATGDRAKYRIKRDHNIDGQTVTITYYIYFSKNGNGLWQIERY